MALLWPKVFLKQRINLWSNTFLCLPVENRDDLLSEKTIKSNVLLYFPLFSPVSAFVAVGHYGEVGQGGGI